MDGLYQVSLITNRGPVCFGFIVSNGRVIKCAPYGYKWLNGRRIDDIIPNKDVHYVSE
jgi:hypothetical protein